jgi:prepilin-type N-terminal cleavage/methylation domain-containing protein
MKTIQHISPGPPRGRFWRARAGRRGVTLIEVVAALGIMAVGIVGLLTLFPLGLDASARAGDRTTAAILGEYVIEQVRLRQDKIATTDNTRDALEDSNVLNWKEYTDIKGLNFTFELRDKSKPYQLPGGVAGYGSGEQIVKQLAHPENSYDPQHPDDPTNGLSGMDLFSRYEVAIRLDEIEDNNAFTSAGHKDLMQVTVMVRWPRAIAQSPAAGDELRKNQETMTFVTYIRPGS